MSFSNILSKHLIFNHRLCQLFSATNPAFTGGLAYFSHTPIRQFYEPDRRGGGPPIFYSDIHWKVHIRDGRKIFWEQCKLFREEVKEHFLNDPKMYADGDTDVFFRFDKKDDLKKWRISSDKVNKEGFSECTFDVNDRKKAVFCGTIDTTPPKDGKGRYAGYCAIRSVRKTKSFLRDDYFYWSPFTHLELRVKGDGRNYMVNLNLGMFFDVTWFDMYSYPLFTHGGPYWQTVRIPFSKFFLQSKGRVQDNQELVTRNRINSVGITAATVPGPFHLEIDYIGCHIDHSHKEKFAYELYKIPKEFVTA